MKTNSEPKLEEARRAIVDGEFKRAVAILSPLAEAGQPDPQYLLGELYHLGHGVMKNLPTAVRLYMAAAENQHPGASFAIGSFLMGASKRAQEAPGARSSEFFTRAHDLILEAASVGNFSDCGIPALIYRFGLGVDRNVSEAVRWYEIAFRAGAVGEANNLYLIYREELPFSAENHDRARYWRQKAIDNKCLYINDP